MFEIDHRGALQFANAFECATVNTLPGDGAKEPSTMLIQDAEVEMKWGWKR